MGNDMVVGIMPYLAVSGDVLVDMLNGSIHMANAATFADRQLVPQMIAVAKYCQVMVLMYFCSNDEQRPTEIISVQ